MAWDIEDIQVESVEEILDTNCDVYIKRMEHYLSEQDFTNAYAECEQYLSLGGVHGIYLLMKQCIKNVQDGRMLIYCKIDIARLHVHVIQGESLEFYINRADESVNELKDMLMGTTKYIGDVLGLTGLYNEIVDIYTEKRSLIKTAKTVDEAIKRRISVLSKIDPDDKLGKVATLKQVVYDGDYEEEYTQSIFMSIAKAITWIGKKIGDELWKWFGMEMENDILDEISVNVANCFKGISNSDINMGKASGSLPVYLASYIKTLSAKLMYSNLEINAIADALHKSGKWEEIHLRKVDDESDLHMGKELL